MANNNNNKTLNVPNMRFPEFSGEWKRTTAAEVCFEFKSGKGLKAENISSEGLYPVFGGNGLRGYTNTFNHDGFYVLIGRQGALCGNINITDGQSYITEHAIAVQADSENETKFFQYLFLKMNLGQFSDQSAQPGLAVNKLLKLPFYLPSKQEQLKIANLLALLDERIATQNKIINKLESLIKGLGDSLINEKIPKTNFSNVYVKAGEGGTPTTSKSEYYDGGAIPFIKIDDLTNKYIISNKDYITELGLQKSSAWIIPPKSIIYSNGATIGAISINIYSVCTKQGVLGIVPTNMIDLEYLYYFMKSTYFRKQVSRIVTEGTMKTAYLKDINNIHCPIPELKTQQAISKTLRSISEKMMDESNILNHYKKVKEYLLQQMFI